MDRRGTKPSEHLEELGRKNLPTDRCADSTERADHWSVERHLSDVPEDIVRIYERFVESVAACGPFATKVSKTAITIHGSHRGFAGAKPRRLSLDGFLDLQRPLGDDRFRRVSAYTR